MVVMFMGAKLMLGPADELWTRLVVSAPTLPMERLTLSGMGMPEKVGRGFLPLLLLLSLLLAMVRGMRM